MSSLSFAYCFPADPLGAKPDWSRLRENLFSSGIFAERADQRGPVYSINSLWIQIAEDRGLQPLSRGENIGTLEELIDRLQKAGILPAEFRIEADQTSIPELADRLRGIGLIPADFLVAFSEELKIGPRFSTLFDVPYDTSATEITYEDDGDGISIFCGTETLDHPSFPGTDRVVEDEDGVDMISRWYEDQTTRWTDPETGRSYGLLELDWENTLGAGKCALKILKPGHLNIVRLADLLTDLSGIPFRFAFVYL